MKTPKEKRKKKKKSFIIFGCCTDHAPPLVIVSQFPVSNGRAVEWSWTNGRKAKEISHWLSSAARESSDFFLRATTLAPLRSLKAVRQSFGPEEQGAQPAPQLQSNPKFVSVCEFACACWRCSEWVCVSVNLKIETFPDATATATTQSLGIPRIKPKVQTISVHYLLDRWVNCPLQVYANWKYYWIIIIFG